MRKDSLSLLLFISLIVPLSACVSTTPTQPSVPTDLQVKGNTHAGDVGLTKENEVMIQQKTSAAAELTMQQNINERLVSDLKREYLEIKRCREDMADPRLGGSGKVPPHDYEEEWQKVKAGHEQLGLDEHGNLVVLRREGFQNRLAAERQLQKKLQTMLTMVSRVRVDCEYKMGLARVRYGLPAERYKAEGYFAADGTWIEKRKGETSLDDAFKYSQTRRPRD